LKSPEPIEQKSRRRASVEGAGRKPAS
jgi:hypothetical protein